jgi:hypothetical protein
VGRPGAASAAEARDGGPPARPQAQQQQQQQSAVAPLVAGGAGDDLGVALDCVLELGVRNCSDRYFRWALPAAVRPLQGFAGGTYFAGRERAV